MTRVYFWLGFVTIALQRIGVPVGDRVMPIAPLIILLTLTVLFASRAVRVASARLMFFSGFVAYACVTTILFSGSATSLFQVAALWLPAIFILPRHGPTSFLEGAVLATVLASVMGLVQSVVSASTGLFLDPISTLNPALLVPGFNTSYEVIYGSGWMKANGILFLEASFLSLFCALALMAILTMDLKLPRWLPKPLAIGALSLGLISAVAVSALVVVPALILWIIFNFRRSIPVVASFLLLLPVFALLPQSSAIVARALDTENSSNGARLVRPYEILLPEVMHGSPLAGLGSGSARMAAAELYTGWQSEVTTPTMVKIAYEYGIIGIVFFAIAIWAIAVRSALPGAMKFAIILALIVPTDGLSSGVIVPFTVMALALTGVVDNRDRLTKPRPIRNAVLSR